MKGGALGGVDLSRALCHSRTILGIAAMAASAVVYIAALRILLLSIAMPCMDAGFLMTALIAHLLWNEPFGLRPLAAFGFIGIGLYLLHR